MPTSIGTLREYVQKQFSVTYMSVHFVDMILHLFYSLLQKSSVSVVGITIRLLIVFIFVSNYVLWYAWKY